MYLISLFFLSKFSAQQNNRHKVETQSVLNLGLKQKGWMATPIQGDSRLTISIILGIRRFLGWPKRSNYLINPLQHKLVNESESESRSAVSDSLRPHGLYSPWNSPGQNTGVGFPSPGDIPNPGIEPRSPALQEDSFPAQLPGKPYMFKTVGTEVKDRELILDNL